MTPQAYEYIRELEEARGIDPECRTCQEIFYPRLKEGKKLYEIFAPGHQPSRYCQSGKNNHCTCDTCF
jgi:hypothetical protein